MAEYWTPMVDEMRDCSCKELMSICICYCYDGTINERCISVVEAKQLDAESLTKLIQSELSPLGLDPKKAVAQCYDGAAAMSGGVKSGVQVRMRETYGNAVYIHCWAHKLNLVLVDVCADTVPEFFSILKSLYNFFSGSKLRHSHFITKQKALHPTDRTHKLQSLSNTRWSSRFLVITAIRKSLDALLNTLHEIGQGSGEEAAMAKGLLSSIQSKKFIFLIVMFKELLDIT